MENGSRVINPQALSIKSSKEKNKTFSSFLNRNCRELISILFWVYVIVKVFIYDIDIYIITKYIPDAVWLIQYKFIIILSIIAIFWLITKSENIIPWLLYILFYPIIVVCWKVPKAIYKTGEWNVGIACINSFLSFFKSFKHNFISFSFFITSCVVILNFNNKILLIVASLVLIVVLFIIFINRFVLIFKPSLIYKIQLNVISKILDFNKKHSTLDKELSGLDVSQMSGTQLQKWTSSLQMMVIGNRFCYFLSSKLRNYQKSKINIIFNVFTLLLLLFFTIIIFSMINIALYRAFPDSYKITSITPDFFNFFYYSFNAIHFNSINEIKAVSDYTKAVFLLEQLFALILGGIFFTLFLSVKNERESADIDEVIKLMSNRGDELATYIESEYNLSIDNAIKELERLKGSFINIIFYMSKDI